MGQGVKNLIVLIALFLFYIFGSLIFTKGFLLKRVVVNKNSSCHVDFAKYNNDVHGEEGCWLPRRFNKAIIIIIDALRFDFMAPSMDPSADSIPYLNKMPSVKTLIESHSKNARLYKFIADPPTTTLQRLKGLTTGSLPTFVDAGSNFASSEITEDNFLDQLVRKEKKITFMGDDTWISLFPGRFNVEFSFPSFNVKDLHTVDNGILENLHKETKNKNWDVIIAHFLGVDHCGHTYGPNHPSMMEKLSQMDQVISNVSGLLDKDTIMFVMGDHGMTATGDHGGDSQDELSAGLFVYSPSQITSSQYVKDVYKTVSQTDFVPTVSLLLGIPIPFSNLGTVITDLLNYCPWSKDTHIKEVYHTVQALRLNAHQMRKFVDSYLEVSSDLAEHRYSRLQNDLWDTEQQLQNLVTEMFIHGDAEHAYEKLHSFLEKYLIFTQEVREMCKDVWAKFDLINISLGIIVMLVSLTLNIYLLNISLTTSSKDSIGVVIGMTGVFVLYSAIQTFYIEGKLTNLLAFVLGLTNITALVIMIRKKIYSEEKQKVNILSVTFPQIYALIAIMVAFFTHFSNSFVIYEDRIATFFAQTLIAVFCLYSVLYTLKKRQPKQQKSKTVDTNYDIVKCLTQPVMIIIYLFIICSTCLRLSANFRACREEQINCTISFFLQPLSGLGKTVEGSKNVRYFISASSLIVLVLMFRRWLKHYGNLNGNSLSVICALYFLPVSAAFSILYWAVLGLPEKLINSLPVWQQTLFAQLVYLILMLSVVAIIASPLCVYVIPTYKDHLSMLRGTHADLLIKQVYNHMKLNWSSISETNEVRKEEPPVVYGLGTVYTSTILYVGSIIYILSALLLGDGLSLSLLLSLVTLFTFLELYSVTVTLTHMEKDFLGLAVIIVTLLSTNFFYATGHQATIPSIRFEAAFIGFHGNWDNKILPTMLIHLNTFAAETIFTWMSPLLILWLSVNGLISKYVVKTKEEETLMKGDFVFYENQNVFMSKVMTLCLSLYFCNGIKLFGSMMAAFIHRRHLFVWKIFAPRFVFQAMSSFTVFGVAILSVLFILRVNNTLRKMIIKLSEKCER